MEPGYRGGSGPLIGSGLLPPLLRGAIHSTTTSLIASRSGFIVLNNKCILAASPARNAASYCPRPRLRSQTTMSMMAPTIAGGVHHPPGKRGCPGWRWGSQGFAKYAEV